MEYEEDVLQQITEARTKVEEASGADEAAEADEMLRSALGDVFAVADIRSWRRARGSPPTVNPENAVVNEDRSTPMFVVSDQRESELMSSMTWRATGMIAGGFVLAVGGFAALVWYVGLL
ncbi:MAG: LemA family protein [Halobacteriota archaeon]